MIAPDTFLGLSIALVAMLLIAERRHALQTEFTLQSPYVLLNLGVIVGASTMTAFGFFETFQSILTPVTSVLVDAFGLPTRWQSNTGMGAARYTPSDVLRVLVVIPVLLYASHRDIKERIVRDWVWLPLFGFGLVFLTYDFWTGSIAFLGPWVLGNLAFALFVGYLLYVTNLFGGADMKAIWALGLLIPTYPALVVFPRILPPLLATPYTGLNMFALTILSNTAFIALLWPLVTLGRNLQEGFIASRPGLMLTARRVPLEAAIHEHGKILPTSSFEGSNIIGRGLALIRTVTHGIDTQFVREYLDWHNDVSESDLTDPSDIDKAYVLKFLESDANRDENGVERWGTPNHDEGDEQAEAAFDHLIQQEEVWMTPGIPFIVPILLGLLVSLTIGDLVYWVVVALN